MLTNSQLCVNQKQPLPKGSDRSSIPEAGRKAGNPEPNWKLLPASNYG